MTEPFQPDSQAFLPSPLAALDYPTPFLLMDTDVIERAYRQLQAALPGVRLHYAMKCNPDRPILERIKVLGGGFEIASYPELEMLTAIGVDPADVLFSNPVKPPAHVARAAAAGLWRFACDSRSELRKIAEFAPGAAVYARLEIAGSDSLVQSEGKFGVGADEARSLLEQAAELGLRPYGLAFHVGSQKLTPHAWRDAIAQSAAVMRQLAAKNIKLEMLDIGGGFAARYSDHVPDHAAFGQVITQALRELLPYEVELVAEPGRALVAEAGVMVATVIGTAERRGRRWLHLDVGAFNGLMEALETGNQLRFPLTDELDRPDKRAYHLTGPSCDSQDSLLFDAELSDGLDTGHRVFIHSTGAYTTSYASTFNGFDIPLTRYLGQR